MCVLDYPLYCHYYYDAHTHTHTYIHVYILCIYTHVRAHFNTHAHIYILVIRPIRIILDKYCSVHDGDVATVVVIYIYIYTCIRYYCPPNNNYTSLDKYIKTAPYARAYTQYYTNYDVPPERQTRALFLSFYYCRRHNQLVVNAPRVVLVILYYYAGIYIYTKDRFENFRKIR